MFIKSAILSVMLLIFAGCDSSEDTTPNVIEDGSYENPYILDSEQDKAYAVKDEQNYFNVDLEDNCYITIDVDNDDYYDMSHDLDLYSFSIDTGRLYIVLQTTADTKNSYFTLDFFSNSFSNIEVECY